MKTDSHEKKTNISIDDFWKNTDIIYNGKIVGTVIDTNTSITKVSATVVITDNEIIQKFEGEENNEIIGCIDSRFNIITCNRCNLSGNREKCDSYRIYAEADVIHDDLKELERLLK